MRLNKFGNWENQTAFKIIEKEFDSNLRVNVYVLDNFFTIFRKNDNTFKIKDENDNERIIYSFNQLKRFFDKKLIVKIRVNGTIVWELPGYDIKKDLRYKLKVKNLLFEHNRKVNKVIMKVLRKYMFQKIKFLRNNKYFTMEVRDLIEKRRKMDIQKAKENNSYTERSHRLLMKKLPKIMKLNRNSKAKKG